MDDFDEQLVDAMVSGEEVGADEVWDAMAELADETAGEEVGALFRRRGNLSAKQKRRRRLAGAIFGGPLGMMGAGIKRAKENRRLRKGATNTTPGGNQGLPQALRKGFIPSDRRIEPIGLGEFDFTPGGDTTLDLLTRLQVPVQYTRLIISAFAYSEDPNTPGSFVIPVADGDRIALSLLRILDWRVGVDPIFRSNQPVPAAAYSPERDGQIMMTRPAKSGLDNLFRLETLSKTYRLVGAVSAEAYTSES